MNSEESPEPLDRLWQLLWSCCNRPRPSVLSTRLVDLRVEGTVVVVCGNCGAVH